MMRIFEWIDELLSREPWLSVLHLIAALVVLLLLWVVLPLLLGGVPWEGITPGGAPF